LDGRRLRLYGNVHGTARQVNDDASMRLALRSASVIIFCISKGLHTSNSDSIQ